MIIGKTFIKDLVLIQRFKKKDKRGYLERLYCDDTLKKKIKFKKFVQVNHTLTKNKGTVRGLHFQTGKFMDAKIVSCIKGQVWDVAVDLRKNSKTFLKFFHICLSEKNSLSLFIPKGFAHGFQALMPNSEMIYFHSSNYNKKNEDGLNILDPKINIKWPIPIKTLSRKDRNYKFIDNNFKGY